MLRLMGCQSPGSAHQHTVLMDVEFEQLLCFFLFTITPLGHVEHFIIPSFHILWMCFWKLSEFPTNHSRWRAQSGFCRGFFCLLCGSISRFSWWQFLAASLCRVLTQAVSKRTTQSNVSSWVCSDSFTLKC